MLHSLVCHVLLGCWHQKSMLLSLTKWALGAQGWKKPLEMSDLPR